MKLKIEIPFRDKFTKELYSKGDIKDFDDERAKELLADERKLVSVAPKKTAPKKSKK